MTDVNPWGAEMLMVSGLHCSMFSSTSSNLRVKPHLVSTDKKLGSLTKCWLEPRLVLIFGISTSIRVSGTSTSSSWNQTVRFSNTLFSIFHTIELNMSKSKTIDLAT